jgi:filamentous hemagglutinin family protein
MSRHWRRALLMSSALVPLTLASAVAGPNGASVVGGSATVQGQGTANVVVNQTSNSAIINWNTFNIGAGETTRINMPSASSTELDRVTGGLGPSQILGSLSSNGQVFLVNPDGILFGAGSRVNVGGLLATTNNISNSNFMAGNYSFSIPGMPNASIVNAGSITAQTGGFAALVAPGVRNTGTITAKLGTVALASGNTFTLDLYGDNLITLGVNDSIASQVIDVSTGQPLSSLVSNAGTLKANGGTVVLTAVAARQVVDSVISNTGVIEANTIGTHKGMIVLAGATAANTPTSAPTQTVKVSGTLSAAGKRKGTKGGTVVVTGGNVQINGATINASGQAGGGTVLIGGRKPGASTGSVGAALIPFAVPTATTVSVDATTTINASATGQGNGGTVILWSNEATTFYGTILAQGGAQAGNGGYVETSGGTVNFAGIRVDTTAPAGKTGTWLLDPTDLIIDATAAATINTDLQTTNVTLATSATGAPSGPAGTTGNTNSSGNGDIIVDSPLSWTTATTLTLNSYNAITINAPITVGGAGGLSLTAANNPLAPAAPLISFGNGASVQYTGTPNTGQSLTINGQAYTLLYSMSDVRNINATTASLSGYYALAVPLNASGVANWTPIGTDGAGNVLNSSNGFSGAFEGLGNTISNLTVNPASTNYIGLFGVSSGAIRNVGLVNETVDFAASAGASPIIAGGLAGVNMNSGTISGSYATGTLSGTGTVSTPGFLIAMGGLVGLNGGTIVQSYADSTVSSPSVNAGVEPGDAFFAVGGLVGWNFSGTLAQYPQPINLPILAGLSFSGTVTQSYSSGAVNGGIGANDIGGLVGQNDGSVMQSYATGAVYSPTGYAGGLVGSNGATVTQSYATGAVNGGTNPYAGEGFDPNKVGGLVGTNNGNVTQSYATGAVSAGTDDLGGLAGSNGGTIAQSYATGAVISSTSINVGGLVGINNGSVSQSYATGAVSGGPGPVNVGGLVGLNDTGSTVSSSFWDATTTGQTSGVGTSSGTFSATGLTTSQFATASNFSGWNFGTTPGGASCASGGACWVIVDVDGSLNNAGDAAGATRPMLLSEWSTTITNAHQLQLMELAPTATDTLANNIDLGPPLSNASDVWGPNGAAGFVPIGNATTQFTGTFNGGGNTISNLTINMPSSSYVGLFGDVGTGGSVQNIGLIGGSVTGNYNVGALVGLNGGSVTQSYATGAVSGGASASAVGGLVGQNGGSVTQSYATGAVSVGGADSNDVGGLVGWNNNGTVSQSYATGTVSGSGSVGLGGLVGGNEGSGIVSQSYVVQSYATGTVNGQSSSSVGGLVGVNGASVTQSYATGAVSGVDYVGGLVGQNNGSVMQSYATGAVSGVGAAPQEGLGGLVGLNNGGASVAQSYATGAVSGGSASSGSGGLIGVNSDNGDVPASVTQSYATGAVSGGSGSTGLGGLVGQNGGTVTSSYWDIQTSGQSTSAGGTGLTTAQFQAGLPSGFDPTVWGSSLSINNGHPYLLWQVAAGSPPVPNDPTGASSGSAGPSSTTVGPTGATGTAGPTGATGSIGSTGSTSTQSGGTGSTGTAGGTGSTGTAGGTGSASSGGATSGTGAPPSSPTSALTATSGPATPIPSTIASLSVSYTDPYGVGQLFTLNATKQTVNNPADAATLASLTPNYAAYLQTLNQAQTLNQLAAAPGPGSLPPLLGKKFFVAPSPKEMRYVKNEVVLYVSPSVPAAQVQATMDRLRLTVLGTESIGTLGVSMYRVRIGQGSTVNSVIQELSKLRIVASAQANYVYTIAQDAAPAAAASAPGQDPDVTGRATEGDPAQYALDKLGVPDVHRFLKGTGIKIAVIDSEIDMKNPELDGVIADHYDAVGHTEKPDAHGTGMAGAIAAHGRLMGIAPSARLYAVHAFSPGAGTAESTSFNILKGLDHAVTNGVRVINMSFTGPRDTSMERVLHVAHDQGIVLIAAAGNDGPRSRPDYPGAFADVIAVTATDVNDKVFAGANRGPYIAVAAPGVDILVPAPEAAYQLTTGTSVASAEVSGIVALLLQRNPNLTPNDIRSILTSSARHPGTKQRDDDYGSGLVDPPKAIQSTDEVKPSASRLDGAPAAQIAGQSNLHN